MEITGKVLREVEFRDRLRGYDTDEVDEFLERVAVAIDELNAEHSALRSRADAAERQLQQMPPLDDDGIRRTLVLAQRTADLAVREARAEAEQLLGEARARSEAVLAEAEEEAARLREEADRDVRSRTSRLSDHHERLTREIRILEALLESERTRITQSLSEALRFVGESMAVSDDVTAAVGPAGEPQQGDGGSGEHGGLDAFPPLDPGRSGELGLGAGRSAPPPHPVQGAQPAAGGTVPIDAPRDIPPPPLSGPPTSGAPTSGPPGPPSTASGPVASGREPSSPPAAGSSAAGSSGSVLEGAAGPPAAPQPAGPPLSSPGGRRAAGDAGDEPGPRHEAAAPSVRSGRSANASPTRSERDIEAELLEDAGLVPGRQHLWDEPPPGPATRPEATRSELSGPEPPRPRASRAEAPRRQPPAAGRPPRPSEADDPTDDDALWARWAAGGGAALDPLSEPPPTQAYRLERDGGWTA